MSTTIYAIKTKEQNTNIADFCSYTEGDVEMVSKEHGIFLEDYKGNVALVELEDGDITSFTRYGDNDIMTILDHFIDFTEGNVRMMTEDDLISKLYN